MGSSLNARNSPSDIRDQITAVSVRGFKSICDETRIEIRPLTILAGANSSGKSSAMQPLLLLKQTLEARYDPGPLRLDGDNVRFTTVQQFLSRSGKGAASEEFRVTVHMRTDEELSLVFRRHANEDLDIPEMRYTGGGHDVTLRQGMRKSEILRMVPEALKPFQKSLSEGSQRALEWSVQRTRCFLELCLRATDREGPPSEATHWGTGWPCRSFEEAIRNVIHVPGLRVSPTRAYSTSGVGPVFEGTFENYIASLIHKWQAERDDRLDQLGRALASLGLTWKVEARRLDDTRIELLVPRPPRRPERACADLVNIADVGLGVSQALPALVALIRALPGQTVYLEEPEIHLHPRAQTGLAGLLADAAKRGVRVVAETHSSLLLLGIQTLVAEGKLSPDLVKLHWFKRDNRGATKVMPADLDKAGAFGDWPEDFGDVELKAQSRFLDASEKRLVEG
jgi:hypothetical protein